MGTIRSELKLTVEQQTFFRRMKMMAIRKQPYIATIINNLIPVNCPQLETLAIDDNLRLYVDFDYVMGKGYEYAAGVLAHEPWHVLRKHSQRSKKIGVTTDFEYEVFNNAADLEINDDIKPLIPEEGIQPGEDSFVGFKPYLNAEDYYYKIIDLLEQDKASQQSEKDEESSGEADNTDDTDDSNETSEDAEGGSGSSEEQQDNDYNIGAMLDALKNNNPCGSGSGGKKLEEYELTTDGDVPSVPDFNVEIIRKKVAQAVLEADEETLTADGMKSASLKLWAEEVLNHNPVDWRDVFNSNLRNAVKHQSGYADYNFRKIARRQPIQGILLPARTSPAARVGLGIDTSGSNIGKLGVAVEEIMSMVDKVGIRGRDLIAFSVDENIEGEPDYITRKEDISFNGSGGTDLNKAFDYVAEKLSKKIDIFVLLTDGEYNDWYEEKPEGTGKISFIVVLIVDSIKEPEVTEQVISVAESKLNNWANLIIIDLGEN